MTVRQPDLLLLLQQRGSESGDSDESPADHALPPRPHLCPLPIILPHQCQGMHCHAHACNHTPTDIGDDNDYEEYRDNDNGERDGNDDKFKLKKD